MIVGQSVWIGRTFAPASSFCTPSVTTRSPSEMPETTRGGVLAERGDRHGSQHQRARGIDQIDRRSGAAVEDGGERQPCDLRSRGERKPHRRRHAEHDGAVRILDREARSVGARQVIGLWRQLAQDAP